MNRGQGRPALRPQVRPRPGVLLVGSEQEWPAELGVLLERDGYVADRVAELALVPPLLTDERVRAVLVSACPRGASDLLILRRLREAAPHTALVVVTKTPTEYPDLKRAFENGATAFLSWPSSTDALRHAIESRARRKAVLVGDDRDWPPDLKDSLGRDGYLVDNVAELSLVPSLLMDGTMRALFVVARPLAASDLLLLRRVRETSPRTAIVVVTRTPTHPDLKRAFESGATAFLSWPASTDSLRQAIESGSLPLTPGSEFRP